MKISREQAVSWLSPLNLHIAGAALLAVVNLYLLVHIALVWSNSGTQGEDALATARAEQVAAEIAARPLRGLDTKIEVSNAEATKFYEGRLPYAYSNVAAELGALKTHYNVRLSRVQYLLKPAANGVSEVGMDAALTGDYRSLAGFINGLERDRSFFLITAIGLTGQQTGIVNLRMRLTTYLREPMPIAPSAANGEGAAQ
jgi:type IV pilus assembly protein PilO